MQRMHSNIDRPMPLAQAGPCVMVGPLSSMLLQAGTLTYKTVCCVYLFDC